MFLNILQKFIRWMPFILLVLLFTINRDNVFQKTSYIILLLAYTILLVLRILYAKEKRHEEFNKEQFEKDSSIEKMSDYQEQIKIDHGKNKKF